MFSRPDTQPEVRGALQSMLQLEQDSLVAYKEAVRQLSRATLRLAFEAFAHHHARHIAEIDQMLRGLSIEPWELDSRAGVAKKRIALVSVARNASHEVSQVPALAWHREHDLSILRAMKKNEDATHAAYVSLVSRPGLAASIRSQMQDHLDDEQRHVKWLDEAIEHAGNAPAASSASPVSGGRAGDDVEPIRPTRIVA
jgi:rubrerythrin